MPSQNQQIWNQSPILCFEESTKSMLKVYLLCNWTFDVTGYCNTNYICFAVRHLI